MYFFFKAHRFLCSKQMDTVAPVVLDNFFK